MACWESCSTSGYSNATRGLRYLVILNLSQRLTIRLHFLATSLFFPSHELV
jgi:hypothetical protein